MNETQRKALLLLGLARKARKLEIGEEPCGIACRSGKAKLLLLSWVGHAEADREFSGVFFNIHCVYRSVPPDRAADSLSHLRQCPQ